MERKVKTPCVGVCSTVFGDQVCRGCKRFHHEVIEWNGYTDVQKETVWNRLESLKVLIMKSKIFIENQVYFNLNWILSKYLITIRLTLIAGSLI